MKYLLDSNACITHLRQPKSLLSARLRATAVDDVVLCSIVRAELIYGAYRSRDPKDGVKIVDDFVIDFESLTFDNEAANKYGEIRAHLAAAGTPIGPNDLFIAAIALANDLIVVTNNTAEFQRVPGLQCEDWSQP